MTIKEYISANFLAREVQQNMIAQLDLMQADMKIMIDVGCGVGELTQAIHQQYPNTHLIGLGSSEQCLKYAKEHSTPVIDWCQIESFKLPFRDQSINVVISNLWLARQADLNEVFSEWRRILKPNGLILFSTLGPDSLREISTHQLHLVDMHDIGDLLLKLGFEDPVLDVDTISVTYKDIQKMQDELMASDMVAENEFLLSSQSMTLTYEVVYAHAWRPRHINFSADETGIVKIPLEHLRRR